MTTDTTGIQWSSHQNDRQDRIRRGLFDGYETIASIGATMKIQGTGWYDREVVNFNTGYGFNPAAGLQSEVLSFDALADTDNRHALMSIPRDKQHEWERGASGIQDAGDPSRRVEFGPDGLHMTNGTAFFGPNRELSVSIDEAGNITIATGTTATINFVAAGLQHNGTNIGASHTHTDPAGIAGGQTSGPS